MWRSLFEAVRDAIPPPAVVALLSAAPISEVRGGIPAGLLLDMPLAEILPIAIIANVVIVIPVLLWFNPLADWLIERGILTGIIRRLIARARSKKPMVDKYGVFAVTLFVAIPLPVTGAWTGALVASVFKMDFWRALACMLLGVIIASIIVTLLYLGGVWVCDTAAA
ncbi:MAG: small multi-drug export protein [Armatimonadota bacterium]|nr:small multi-drug export protein [Armatimonadota bacterium]